MEWMAWLKKKEKKNDMICNKNPDPFIPKNLMI